MTDLETRPRRPRRHRGDVPEPSRPPAAGQRVGNPIGVAVLAGLIVLAGVGGGWPLLVVIAAILVMIFLHELGHYLTAK
ncbi:MAG: hypothetical protein H0W25_14615 [Acidimicrobiia bacterium]|nr:hypothetical protein [Acidimicrobiia bacterium]